MNVSKNDVSEAINDLSEWTKKNYVLKWQSQGFGEIKFNSGEIIASGSPKELWNILVALLNHERNR